MAKEDLAVPAAANAGGTASTTADPSRAIVEADIIQLNGGRLYAMSRSGTLSVIDVSTPAHLTMLGQATLPGEPFEMYQRGDYLVTMENGARDKSGNPVAASATTTTTDPTLSASVIVLDVHDPAHISQPGKLDVPGEVADSRVVGDVLYLATYENAQCLGCGSAPRTMVTTFNIADPAKMAQVDQASFQSNAPDQYNLPWGSNWKRSIFVNDQRLYIGGHADVDPATYDQSGVNEGIIDVLDVTDPSGKLGTGQRLTVAGAILSRWQLDERDGVLRVISQRGAGRTGNGLADPEVATFRVASASSITALGHATIQLPRQEGLRTVRFDAERAYAITYNQTDPLFVIDLHDPAAPAQKGQLAMPGFMFYLEPYGDRLIGLGIDRADPNGSLNVSLFNVADASNPTMLQRVAFATPQISEDYEILNSEVSEDQDRIQKAFHVFPGGLVVVPFSALLSPTSTTDACANAGGGVQLVQWTGDTLSKRALLPLPGNPRRALENGDELLTVSDSNVRSFSLSAPVLPLQTADLVIGTCTPRSTPTPTYGGLGGGRGGGGGFGPWGCF